MHTLIKSTNEPQASVNQSFRALQDPSAGPRAALIIHFFCSVSSSSAEGSGISCTALKNWGTCSNGTENARDESWEKGENRRAAGALRRKRSVLGVKTSGKTATGRTSRQDTREHSRPGSRSPWVSFPHRAGDAVCGRRTQRPLLVLLCLGPKWQSSEHGRH